MGLFDTIKVSAELAKLLQFNCVHCGKALVDLQTKDFSCNMEDYHLKLDAEKCIRLYKLDWPDKAIWWRDYNEGELEASRKKCADLPWGPIPGDTGKWIPGTWLPENRNNRFMGAWPHEAVDAYDWCSKCKVLTTFDFVFFNGVCVEVRSCPVDND